MVYEAAAMLRPSLPSHVKMNIVVLVLESDISIFWDREQDFSLCFTAEDLSCNKLRPLLFSKKNDIIELI